MMGKQFLILTSFMYTKCVPTLNKIINCIYCKECVMFYGVLKDNLWFKIGINSNFNAVSTFNKLLLVLIKQLHIYSIYITQFKNIVCTLFIFRNNHYNFTILNYHYIIMYVIFFQLVALQAPFHLNTLDMNLMTKRIINGFYPPIPSDSYSMKVSIHSHITIPI